MNVSVPPDRCMARVVSVIDITEIPRSQNLELVSVLGWKVIARKGEFKIGDLAIYFSIDAVLENLPETQFLEGKPLKKKKILGVISEGLLAPLEWFRHYGDPSTLQEGMDITKEMKVMKSVSREENFQYEVNRPDREKFPEFIVKTDEERIQNVPHLLVSLRGKRTIITRKEDGCSATYGWDGTRFYVCGRNFVWLLEDQSNRIYFDISKQFDLERKLRTLNRRLALQGEIVGPKINGNRLKLSHHDYRIFNIWLIDEQKYLPWDEVEVLLKELDLHSVPVLEDLVAPFWSIDDLIDRAEKTFYGDKIKAEGIVVKDLDHTISFKVLTPSY